MQLFEKSLQVSTEGIRLFQEIISIDNDDEEEDFLGKQSCQEYQQNIQNLMSMQAFSYGCLQREEQTLSILMQLRNSIDVHAIEDGINNYLLHCKMLWEKRINDGKQLMRLIEKDQLFDFEGVGLYMIPMEWLQKWQKFCQIKDGSQNEDNDNLEEEEGENNGFGEDELKDYPGPIVIDSLLEERENLLLDPRAEYQFTNLVVKSDIEPSEFIYVSCQAAQRLYQQFGGQLLQRYTYMDVQQRQIKVELKLQQINLVILPSILQNQDYSQGLQEFSVQISKKSNLQQLKQKIVECLEILPMRGRGLEFRLWKLEPKISKQALLQQYLQREEGKKMVVEGEILSNLNQVMEECQICESDVVIIEYQQEDSKEYLFKQVQQQQYDQNGQQQLYVDSLQHGNQIFFQCEGCGKEESSQHQLEVKCECEYVKYCDKQCMSKDQVKHKKVHKQAQDDSKKIRSILNQLKIGNKVQEQGVGSRLGQVGLQNLGNTCFMNSSIQCLSNCFQLTEYFLQKRFIQDMNPSNPLGTQCYLSASYYDIIQKLWYGKDQYISPWNFKRVISQFAPQFSGSNQQDSQELLSYLLDGIHEDLNRIKVKPLVEQVESNGQNDDYIAKLSWKNYLKRNQSIIVDLLVGQYKSTLNCPQCQQISVTFDPYMSISLPIPTPIVTIEFQFFFIFRNNIKQPLNVKILLEESCTVKDLKKKLVQNIPGLDEEFLNPVYIYKQQVHKLIEDGENIKKIQNSDHHMFMYQMYDPDYDCEMSKDQIFYKIQLKTFLNKQSQNQNAFSRLFYIKKDMVAYDLYLNVYKLFRQYLKKYFTFMEQSENIQPPVKINADEIGHTELENEFIDLLNQNWLPFELYYQKSVIDHDSQETVYDIFGDRSRDIEVKLYFSQNVRLKEAKILKMNTCVSKNFFNENDKKIKNNYSIYDCLDLFIKNEVLGPGNEWYCSKCKKHQRAFKKMQIQTLPKYLILHIKRFKTGGVGNFGSFYFQHGGEKIKSLIDFPLDDLDLSRYVLEQKHTRESYNYELVAVSNHIGGMGSGHYTAYAKSHINNKWYNYNDCLVTEINGTRGIVSDSAYVLFYKRKQQQ